jgi:aryl-alcohol dehydrogenase-like predicted oxidoreductase
VCLGGNVFGWTIDEQRSFAVLDAYVEAGGNFIDTADSYGRRGPSGAGESERIIGTSEAAPKRRWSGSARTGSTCTTRTKTIGRRRCRRR